MKNKILVLMTFALLTACGGGGGSTGGVTPVVPVGPTPTIKPSTAPQAKLVIGTVAHPNSAQSVTRRNGLTFITVMDASPSPSPSGSPAPSPSPTDSPTPPPTIGVTTVPTLMGIQDSYIAQGYHVGAYGGYTELYTYLDGYASQIPNPMPNVTYQLSGNVIQSTTVTSNTFGGYASNWFPQALELNPSNLTGATYVQASATVSGLNLTATQQVNTYGVMAIGSDSNSANNGIPTGLTFNQNGVAQPSTDPNVVDIYITKTAVYFPFGADLYSDPNPLFETMTTAPEQNVFTSVPTDVNEWEGTGGILTVTHEHATLVFKTHDGRWVKFAPAYMVGSAAFAGITPGNYLTMLSGPYRVSDYGGHFDI